MVTAIQRTPSFLQQFGEGLAQGAIPLAQQQVQRSLLQGALERVKGLGQREGVTPFELASELISATAGIPGAERYVGPLFETLRQSLGSNVSQKVGAPGAMGPRQPNQMQTNQPQPLSGMQNQNIQQITSALQGLGKNVPQQGLGFKTPNIPPLGQPRATGNLPEGATTNEVQRVLTPNEETAMARDLADARTAAGIPTKIEDALPEVKDYNKRIMEYNKQVQSEKENRRIAQESYGEYATDALGKVFGKNIPAELEGPFRIMSENLAKENKSEGQIRTALAEQAKNVKNALANIENEPSAPRFHKNVYRAIEGTYKGLDKAMQDMRVKVKPLLDLKLYDLTRNRLSESGYYPEERESIMNPLPEKVQASINLSPSAPAILGKTRDIFAFSEVHNPNMEELKNGIRESFNADPNVSPVLLRKAFEDKNYDWRVFKDAFNDLVLNKEIELNPDQQTQVSAYLDGPPLNNLERLLESVRLIGR